MAYMLAERDSAVLSIFEALCLADVELKRRAFSLDSALRRYVQDLSSMKDFDNPLTFEYSAMDEMHGSEAWDIGTWREKFKDAIAFRSATSDLCLAQKLRACYRRVHQADSLRRLSRRFDQLCQAHGELKAKCDEVSANPIHILLRS